MTENTVEAPLQRNVTVSPGRGSISLFFYSQKQVKCSELLCNVSLVNADVAIVDYKRSLTGKITEIFTFSTFYGVNEACLPK